MAPWIAKVPRAVYAYACDSEGTCLAHHLIAKVPYFEVSRFTSFLNSFFLIFEEIKSFEFYFCFSYEYIISFEFVFLIFFLAHKFDLLCILEFFHLTSFLIFFSNF